MIDMTVPGSLTTGIEASVLLAIGFGMFLLSVARHPDAWWLMHAIVGRIRELGILPSGLSFGSGQGAARPTGLSAVEQAELFGAHCIATSPAETSGVLAAPQAEVPGGRGLQGVRRPGVVTRSWAAAGSPTSPRSEQVPVLRPCCGSLVPCPESLHSLAAHLIRPRWVNDGRHDQDIARYVIEGDDFANRIAARAGTELRRITHHRHLSFASAVTAGDVGSRRAAVEALYLHLKNDQHLRYEFERDFDERTGGQYVRVGRVLGEEGRGTCIDLVVLFLSCLSNVKLWPVYVQVRLPIPGSNLVDHALAGCWIDDPLRSRRAQGLGAAIRRGGSWTWLRRNRRRITEPTDRRDPRTGGIQPVLAGAGIGLTGLLK
jgi:hypothetical protein